jgi:Raf kinase inhibitor-like YbhB/YbcL family protein
MPFELTSAAFAEGEQIPSEFTCDGADNQPALSWIGTPEGTAELALVMHDPTAGGFVHWVVVGIPADASELPADALPEGATSGRNDFGRNGWAGPCPPSGTHTYVFTLYALSAPLVIDGVPTAQAVRRAAAATTLAQAELRGNYRRDR